jgi:dihydrofolate reductase
MIITLIAACDLDRGIGYQGELPWHLPADLAYFKQKTLGKAILMGRKTYESIGRPLPGRRNLVLTRQFMQISGVEIIHHLDELRSLELDELMVIGGAEVYQQCLPMASRILLTEVHTRVKADAFFPQLPPSFICLFEEHRPKDFNNLHAMTFREYKLASN